MNLITSEWVKKQVHHRNAEGHKKTFGHVLIIAGSEGKSGAAILCARAALYCGSGMVTVMMPNEAVQVLLQECPELMYLPIGFISDYDLSKYDTIAIGPGLGFSEEAKANLIHVLSHFKGRVVVDADALTLLASNMHLIQTNHILTPHPGEFERIYGLGYDANNRIGQLNEFIVKHPSVIVLKGAATLVGDVQHGIMQNTTGNDGMATAGSGDVLTGIIASIAGQGYIPFVAAALGVYIHGLAGDMAIEQISKSGLVASDILQSLRKIRILD